MTNTNAIHVLVTGPDFEVRSESRAGGLPQMVDLLLSMGPPFGIEPLILKPNPSGGLPCLAGLSGSWVDKLQEFADSGQLDQYWDCLLESQLSRLSKDIDKAVIHEQEFAIREAFHRAVQRFDKGHMAQSILAAAIDWDVWINSGFARFANRAIELFAQKQGAGRTWRSVGDARTAMALARLLMFAEIRLLDKAKYFFRLRGESMSITSMAVAGHDKEYFSPLAVDVDSFYQIYNVAEMVVGSYLSRPDAFIIWHIVAESLHDKLLLQCIARSTRHYPNTRAVFIVVDSLPSNAASKLMAVLSDATPAVAAEAIILEQAETPFDYMRRVDRLGLPRGNEVAEIRDWLGSVPSGSSELSHWALSLQDLYFVDEMQGRLQSCFLSHSVADKEFCDRLYQDLRARGVRCWYFPESAIMGRSVWDEIDRNIKIYDRLIVVLSAKSLESGPVLREIQRALNREDKSLGDVLFPIRIDDAVFGNWEHPRRADVASKVIGDFTNWKNDQEKYKASLEKLLRGLQGAA
jgi:hypothetical protein